MSLNKKFHHLKIELTAIQNATNNFSNYIGEGGFGKVYKGELTHSEGNTTVAVKTLDRKFGQGDPEFWKEIMLLSRYRHPNVVSLLGFCDEGGEKILVYEYASRSSLDKYLSGDLTWVQRLNICIGAARGLTYLHNPDGSQQNVLHRDIKSSNILLDENWKAMLSDFGLSKIGPANQEDTFLVSQAVGTAGYCDPNYLATGFLTKESDVYSFGVVLFEVFCGRLNRTRISETTTTITVPKSDISGVRERYDVDSLVRINENFPLTRLARDHYEQNKMKDIIHENIKDEINPDSMNVFTRIAYQCLDGDSEKRPLMTEVVRDLEDALQFQENNRVIIKGELLSVKPQELHFPFELMKEISSSIQLKNRTYSHVAFKVKSTRPNTYAALPHDGILLPQSTCQIKITMQPQKEDPDHDMRCNDKFLVQSAVVSPGVPEVITRELFNKESGNQVGEFILNVIFVAPKLPFVRLIEGPKEDVLPTTSISDAGTVNLSNSNTNPIVAYSKITHFIKESKHLVIPFQVIEKATKNFTTVLGKGGYGIVYKGELLLSGELTSVAVKRLDRKISGQGFKEFLTEIQLLSRYKHPNLVSLLGFCDEAGEMILIYKYAEHGSLDQHLPVAKTTHPLTWEQRISICLDTARGLDYLHNHIQTNHRVIHRDIKSANILIGHDWKAMIADLGLSKIGRVNESDSYLITNASGTYGYCDPAYMDTGILTKESDVYSFGVVMFEVLCGRMCFLKVDNEHRFLARLAPRYYETGRLNEIIDPYLKIQVDSDSLKRFSEIAYLCLLNERDRRPSMGSVVQKLEEMMRSSRVL